MSVGGAATVDEWVHDWGESAYIGVLSISKVSVYLGFV